jgi:hypothetical protein
VRPRLKRGGWQLAPSFYALEIILKISLDKGNDLLYCGKHE